jgi:hypothetical protein
MAIEIVLKESKPKLRMRNVRVKDGGCVLEIDSFAHIIAFGEADIATLTSLSIDRVTVINGKIGLAATPDGMYVLKDDTQVFVKRFHNPKKHGEIEVLVTINATGIQAFMDAYALAVNNLLTSVVKVVPEMCPTFNKKGV